MPAARGAAWALLAALLFGISTPLLQSHGAGVGAFATAALLYAGAALVGALSWRPIGREARMRRADAPRLVAMAACGAVIGPVALAWGLQHTSGTSASLMLTLEAVFTAFFAWALYRESIDGRIGAAMALLLAGGALLVIDQGRSGTAQVQGLLAVLVATAAWGIDNSLSRALADRDPGQVVLAKAALGAVTTALLAAAFGEAMPAWGTAAALVAVGAIGYGLSLRFYLLAQRAFGAARTGSVFAFAPFIGAVAAALLGERAASAMLVGGGVLMLVGVALHLAERHGHAHVHDPLEHEHAHRHDDGHHEHGHHEHGHDHDQDCDQGHAGPHPHDPSGAPGLPPGTTHSHPHRHAPQEHAHPHVPDAHHAHRH